MTALALRFVSPAAALLALLCGPAAAQVQFSVEFAGAGTFASASRSFDTTPDTCNKSDDLGTGPPRRTFSASCDAARSDLVSGVATANATGTLSFSTVDAGVDALGNPLISALSASVSASASTSFPDVVAPGDIGLNASAQGGGGLRVHFEGIPGTPVTVSGTVDPHPAFAGGFGPCAGSSLPTALDASGRLCIEFNGRTGASGFSDDFTASASMSVVFGAAAGVGACCDGEEDCSEVPSATCAAEGGVYRGDGTTCPAACDTDTFVWKNPAGGDYADEENWDPEGVPTVTVDRADTAIFDLTNEYGVNVAGARAGRFVIRQSSIDLVGGTAEVTDGSLVEPSLVVGLGGRLHLVSGTFTSVHSVLGHVSGAQAQVDLISGNPVWINTGRLTIGDAGPGRLTVVAGAATSAESRLGGGLLGPGDAIVGGPGRWTTGNLGLGFGGGPGTLEIRDGGLVVSESAVVGVVASTGNTVTVTGATPGDDDAPSTWNVAGAVAVGKAGAGLLEVAEGGRVACGNLRIGTDPTAAGTVRVRGSAADSFPASVLASGFVVEVGANGTGELFVQDGGSVSGQTLGVGFGGVGTVTVEGTRPGSGETGPIPAFLFMALDATVGVTTPGTVHVRDGAEFNTPRLVIGAQANGEVVVDDGSIATSEIIVLGRTAAGTLTVRNGGLAVPRTVDLGAEAGSTGRLIVTQVHPAGGEESISRVLLESHLRVGVAGTGELVVNDGGKVVLGPGARLDVTADGGLPELGRGRVTIEGTEASGVRSLLEVGDDVRIGGLGSVEVGAGALMRAGRSVLLGGNRGGGTLTARGANAFGAQSSVVVTQNLVVGASPDADGVLSVMEGGFVFVGGTLTIGALGESLAIVDGTSEGGTFRSTLHVEGPTLLGEGSVLFIFAGAQVFSKRAAIGGAGGPGTASISSSADVPAWVVAEDLEVGNDLGTGTLELCPGGLVTVGGTLTIDEGSVVKGNGTVRGRLVINGGTIDLGCSPGTLTIDGTYEQTAAGKLRVEVGGLAPGQFDVLEVTGDATLGGTLELAFVDGFVPRAGDVVEFLKVHGAVTGAFATVEARGLPPGWALDLSQTGGVLRVAVRGDYLCYQTAAARRGRFPKGLTGQLDFAGAPLAFGLKKPALLCNPSSPSTQTSGGEGVRLRGYTITAPSGGAAALAPRRLRVTNGLHPAGDLVVSTKAATLVLAPATQCLDQPTGTCPAELQAPAAENVGSFLCATAKVDRAAGGFPASLTASAVDGFGEPRAYRLAKPTRVCVPQSGDLAGALACYAAKPLAKACAKDAPQNATGACRREADCGGTKGSTRLCAKQPRHAKVGPLVLATALTRDRAGTVKPLELCVPSRLSP
jgi:T5SS/PEP-CTERM-associated repeat protein